MKTQQLSFIKTFAIAALVLILSSIALFPAEAKTVVRTGDEVSIAEDQKIEGDFYTTASKVNISGEILGDALILGGAITINGVVVEDVFAIGGSVDVHGSVGDDLRIIGGDVTIAEPVVGDVFVLGGSVNILSTASVAGDVVVFGGDVEINGPVEGNILGNITTLRIDTSVGGYVDVTTDQLTLGDKAQIAGSVQYISDTLVVRAQNAVIDGEVVRNDPSVEVVDISLQSFLMPALILLFSVALWYLLARRMLTRVVNRAVAPGIRSILIGILVAVLAPFAIAILMASMLGVMAGLVLLLGYILFFILAIVATPAVVGQLLFSLTTKETTVPTLLSLLVGSVIVGLCFIIPVVGPVVLLGFYLLTFGSMVDLLIRANR